MKTSKLSKAEREIRREEIMFGRKMALRAHAAKGVTYVQYFTTRFDKHSSDRQRARYARQIAAGQLRMEGTIDVCRNCYAPYEVGALRSCQACGVSTNA